jgi:hypothetical protein
MDWNAAIEKNREALKRILAMLVAMAGLAGGGAFTSPLWGGRREASGGGEPAITPTRRSDDRRPPHKGEVELRPALPRHLHRAVLRLLRPAEAAARRLIIVAARGLVLPPMRLRDPATQGKVGRAVPAASENPRVRSLPLLDPLPRWSRLAWRPAALGVPRISVPGFTVPFPVRLPSPDDPIDAARLTLRLRALASVLDDLPGQARRFARWRARRDAVRALARQGRHTGRGRRLSPLRPGRPPGGRRRPVHEVHEVLTVVHGLAFWALKPPDTS